MRMGLAALKCREAGAAVADAIPAVPAEAINEVCLG